MPPVQEEEVTLAECGTVLLRERVLVGVRERVLSLPQAYPQEDKEKVKPSGILGEWDVTGRR
jgi:hypothetical protein